MAQDTAIGISYYMQVKMADIEDLASIRQWTNLKVAFDKEYIWITNFDLVQFESVTVKTIPYKTLFYSNSGKLYLQNSLLPNQNEPSFLWTPIQRALPIQISRFNHNYFGIKEVISIQLCKEGKERQGEAMITSLKGLQSYVETAPEVRLQNIFWVLLNNKEALLFGVPILPIKGEVYWREQENIFPVGYNFELHILNKIISNQINPEKDSWILWNKDATYFTVEKTALKQLSLSAFRMTMEEMKNVQNIASDVQ